MFRDVVTVQDAVVAILLSETSNQNQPLLREVVPTIQTIFPDDPGWSVRSDILSC